MPLPLPLGGYVPEIVDHVFTRDIEVKHVVALVVDLFFYKLPAPVDKTQDGSLYVPVALDVLCGKTALERNEGPVRSPDFESGHISRSVLGRDHNDTEKVVGNEPFLEKSFFDIDIRQREIDIAGAVVPRDFFSTGKG